MHLQQIYVLLNNRLASLLEARNVAVVTGEIDRLTQIDLDILSTQSSLAQLKKSIDSGNV
jgi:hypothetical protein